MRSHTVTDALMPRTAQRQTESELRSASVNRTSPVAFASGAQRQKDAERVELDKLMASFMRRGGKVEVLGTTPIQHGKSRRQANAEAGRARTSKPREAQ